MKNSLLLILFSLLATITIDAQKSKYSFKETYDVSTPLSLLVKSNDGDFEVHAHDKNTVEVQYSVRKNGKLLSVNKSEFEALIKNQSKLTIIKSENSLNINLSSIGREGYLNYNEAIIIDFKIYVPKVTTCKLVTSDGDILINGLTSNQKCKTSDGDIILSNLTGNIKAVTSDGDIRLSDLKGNVKATSSDGDIVIKNVDGNVDGRTSDGEVIRK